MKKIFNVQYWQHLPLAEPAPQPGANLSTKVEAGEGVHFQSVGSLNQSRRSLAGIDFNEFNTQTSTEYFRISAHTPVFAPGIFTFKDWHFSDADAMLLNFNSGRCLIGDAVGWGIDFAEWYSRNHFKAEWADDKKAFIADLPDPSATILLPDGIMLSSPGYGIYGHWILDYIPRLYVLNEQGLTKHPLYMVHPPVWAKEFYEKFNVHEDDLHILPRDNLYRSPSMLMPAFLKRGYVVHREVCRAAWMQFSDKMLRQGSLAATTSPDKIFISRSKWNQGRQIANINEIEARAVFHGYTVVYPENLTLNEQAYLFHSARIIVGQDGSALHNIIYSQPGAALGVLNLPSRMNYWHYSICDAMDLRIAYLNALATGEAGFLIDLSAFDELLAALEAVV